MNTSKLASANSLSPDILIPILSLLAGEKFTKTPGGSGYRWLQSIAALNSNFYRAVQQLLYKTVYIPRTPQYDPSITPPTQVMSHNWYSNIPECLRAGKAEETRCLQIVMRNAVQCPLKLFGSAVWTSVEIVEVHGLGFFAGSTLQSPDEQRAIIRDTCLLFRTHLRNVKSLKFCELTGEWAEHGADGDYVFGLLRLCSELQLQYLAQATDVELMPPFPEEEFPVLGNNTRNLRMDYYAMYPLTDMSMPPLPTENLASLTITTISDDPVWSKSDPGLTGTVNLSNLAFLKLRDLSVGDSTQIYTDLYTLFGSPALSTLRIAENYRELHRVTANVIQHARSATIAAGIPSGNRIANTIKEETVHLFTADSDVEELYVIGARYVVPDNIRLYNLRIFYITLHTVTVDDTVDILWMLPRLQHLRIWCNSMSHMDVGISPIRIQRAMPAAVQRSILPAITHKATTTPSTSTARINMPSVSNTHINSQSYGNISNNVLPPLKRRRTDSNTSPAYAISPYCELLELGRAVAPK
ncbi:hypothetical protein DL89DRAFT_316187 [Linderina pennispora]|uniref:F-box domain-containing protein n=1 Tax=Linderina pennispora TaxID=61395 RepID=A0A1Y1W9H3_9FUNG|nr:uncharacterized protein DL89DRAFT_316187 [Linderina pennispora]ORX69958.1 hypothetical protein DL89DRAFT_316187 [Linderina pennispora]